MRGQRSRVLLTSSAFLWVWWAVGANAAVAQTQLAPRAGMAPPAMNGGDSAPAAAGVSGVPGGPPARARFLIKAERGFIDDPFALSASAGLLAVLLTDASSFARIDLIDLSSGKPQRTIELGDPQRLFEQILFSDDGSSVVLISRDAGSGRRSAQHYDGTGKASGAVGPVTDFGVVKRDGQRFLLAVNETPVTGGKNVAIVRHRLAAGFPRVGSSKSVFVSKTDELREPPIKSASWLDGHAAWVGLSPGGYDKAGDVRVPDQAAVFDVLAGKIVFKSPIKDVMAWAASTELRRKFPGRSRFAILAPDSRIFDLVDWLGRHAPIDLPVPLRYYDASTLVEREDTGTGSVFVSLNTDPLHPEALARRKKDPAYFDLYWLQAPTEPSANDPLRPTLRRVLRAPADDRPAAWDLAGGHAVILRKHKNFSRGGALLEIFPLETAVPQ